jgi:glycosyltransferase involved in cell wall biosynthesis
MNNNQHVELSVIVPVTERERYDDVHDLYFEYKRGIEQINVSYEFIYILDGDFPDVFEELDKLIKAGEKIKITKLGKWFGESTSLMVGFDQANGKYILTLPAYQQMEGTEIPKLYESLTGYDLVIGCRWPRIDSFFNRCQSKIFHRIVKSLTGLRFKDLGSGIRLFRRSILEEVTIYGDQHRFLPLFASKYGFRIKEVDVQQSQKDVYIRLYPLGVYIRRLLDIVSVYFLIKFTKKPLRFFGLSGAFLSLLGVLLSLYLAIQRLFFGIALADRPLLLVGLFLIIIGIQMFAIGLVGEIIIFTHAKDLKEYKVEKVVN